MTTQIQVTLPNRGTVTEFLIDVETVLGVASLGDSALAGKAGRTERHRGYTTYFVRSGKRQIFLTVMDSELTGDAVVRRLSVGVDAPEIEEEKRLAISAGLSLAGMGWDVRLPYAGRMGHPSRLWLDYKNYDPAADIVPEVESI